MSWPRDAERAVLEVATRPDSPLHGIDHWRRVADNGLALSASTPGCDGELVALFALIHDSMRLSEGVDPEHGHRAGRLARTLRDDGVLALADERLELLVAAIRLHADGETTADPTIGACWDADRLDLPRVGIRPSPRLLSTRAAVALAFNRPASEGES